METKNLDILLNFKGFYEFWGSELGAKMKNGSKNEWNMGRYLGMDFSSILVGLGSQVGRENRIKIEEKVD